MERDQALENSWYPDLETEEPHFDDERTLISAQPVVRLADVSKVQNRRRLMFVGAFVVAALLGAGAALALVRVRQPVVAGSVADSNAQAPLQEPVAQGATTDTGDSESSSDAQQSDNADTTTETASVDREQKHPKSRIVTRRRTATSQGELSMRPVDQPSDDDQPRLVDQWQERRQRRVNRKPDNHHRTDLFRIREIFEGPRSSRRLGN